MAGRTPDTIRLYPTAKPPVRELVHGGMSSDELAAVLAALPAKVTVVDPQRKVLACSGMNAPHTLVGRDLFEFVPPEHHDWAHDRAVRLRDALLRAGYAVHGDPDRLLPSDRPGVPEPSDAGALELALRLMAGRK